jgi:hypothetical protein
MYFSDVSSSFINDVCHGCFVPIEPEKAVACDLCQRIGYCAMRCLEKDEQHQLVCQKNNWKIKSIGPLDKLNIERALIEAYDSFYLEDELQPLMFVGSKKELDKSFGRPIFSPYLLVSTKSSHKVICVTLNHGRLQVRVKDAFDYMTGKNPLTLKKIVGHMPASCMGLSINNKINNTSEFALIGSNWFENLNRYPFEETLPCLDESEELKTPAKKMKLENFNPIENLQILGALGVVGNDELLEEQQASHLSWPEISHDIFLTKSSDKQILTIPIEVPKDLPFQNLDDEFTKQLNSISNSFELFPDLFLSDLSPFKTQLDPSDQLISNQLS